MAVKSTVAIEPRCGRYFAVVNTQPHKERAVIDNLGRQGYEGYCPKIVRRVSHARKISSVLRPLFPGYLFVALDVERQGWSAIGSTIGVRRVIKFGDRPALIGSGFVQSLKSREVDGAIARPENPYRIGDDVRLHGTAFDGVIAKIVELGDNDRITVLLGLLQRTVTMKTDSLHVQPMAMH